MKTSHKSDELKKKKKRGGVHKSGTYDKTDRHDITEILFKVALNAINLNLKTNN
jgi:hypothetical protein